MTEWTGLKINEAVQITEGKYRWHNVLFAASPPEDNSRRQ